MKGYIQIKNDIVVGYSLAKQRGKRNYEVDFDCVQIPDGVVKISKEAFYNCELVKQVILPDTVTEIDDFAFKNCFNLHKINLPNNLNRIGLSAFYCCQFLNKVEIPQNISEIPEYCFYGCSFLVELKLGSIKAIGKSAFESCFTLTEVEIPNTVKRIESMAFIYCDSIENIIIHEGVEYIGDSAFEGIGKVIAPIQLPESLTEIGKRCFDNYYGTEVKLPKSIKRIGCYVTEV